MSTATSIAARQVYGVQRVCAAWGFPRATFYASAPLVAPDGLASAAPGKRGPKTVLNDAALLALIRADLAASPFIGEGHRKVFARLRSVGGHRVGRNRILRLMRHHQLLSPHRMATVPQSPSKPAAPSCLPPFSPPD
jgi:putative transposase